ncbi:calcium-activated chloride channel regulator 4A-like [Panulirus ornatus]|uniref:calcium-activated chloride channel regulator 4A-like n=1 Tax=Panulirus ornatus TaxID=150431 RepID=UPI003A86E8A5
MTPFWQLWPTSPGTPVPTLPSRVGEVETARCGGQSTLLMITFKCAVHKGSPSSSVGLPSCLRRTSTISHNRVCDHVYSPTLRYNGERQQERSIRDLLGHRAGGMAAIMNFLIQIYEEVYRGNDSVRSGSFVVDSFVGRNLVFKVYTHPSHLVTNPLLLSPLNTHYDNIDEPETVHVARAETGTWRWSVGVSGSSQHYIHVSVSSQPRDAEHGPIHVLAWVGPEADVVDVTSRPAIAYAEVKQGSNPVAGARVRAHVSYPNATLEAEVVKLLDNGRSADIQAGDGTYSSYLTRYPTLGKYTLRVEVSGGSNTFINTQCLTCHDLPHERRRYCCGSEVPLDCKVATPTGVFTRVAPKVVFQVTGLPPLSDPYPPARVRDLQASPSLSQVNLTWTATGDDYDAGTVSGYEIRLSANRRDLLDSTFHLSCRSTLVLSLAQSWARRELFLEGGQTVALRLDLAKQLEYNRLYFVALKATDDTGRKSRVSNVAPVMVRWPSAAGAEGGGGRPLREWQVALVVLGAVIIVADLVGGVFYFVEKYYNFQEMV